MGEFAVTRAVQRVELDASAVLGEAWRLYKRLFARSVVPFDERSEQLVATLAAQAGIALENAILYQEIRKIFEGFVKASVDAIEARDLR